MQALWLVYVSLSKNKNKIRLNEYIIAVYQNIVYTFVLDDRLHFWVVKLLKSAV